MSGDSTGAGDATLPETLGRYRILEHIGQGGMGSVYRAVAEGPEGFRREVALKVVLQGTAQDQLRMKMFHDEARIVARLTHPGIAQVHDFGVEGETAFLVMELVAGLSLQQIGVTLRAEGQRMPEGVALAIGTQVASALAYAHAATDAQGAPMSLVHRDISPDNLLITDEGFVKILDFGIVKAAGRETTTQLGMVKGKPAYMAPEQAQGLELDGRADLFSLGVVLWEALSAQALWRGEDPLSVVGQLLNQPIPHLCDRVADLHAATADAVMAMLEKERESRPDAAACQTMLSRTLSSMRAGSPQETVAAWRRGEIPSPKRLAAGAIQATPKSDAPDAGITATSASGESKSFAALGVRDDRTERATEVFQEAAHDGRSPGEHVFEAKASGTTEPPLELALPKPVDALSQEIFQPDDLLPPGSGASGDAMREGHASPGSRSRAGMGAAAEGTSARDAAAPPWRKVALVAGALLVLLGLGAAGLAIFSPPPKKRMSDADGKVTLRIETDPPGASLVVNGVPVKARSPTSVETLALREHEVIARLEGRVPTTLKISYVQADNPVRIHLAPLLRVEVITDPPGAEVSSDGRVVIVETPGSFERPAGRVTLVARLEGWAPRSTELLLQEEPVTWSPTLLRAAFLQVSSRPSGGEILIQGMLTAKRTPAKVAVTPRKRVVIEVRKGALRARKKLKAPRPGGRQSVRLRLVDPVLLLEKKIEGLQQEIDRLDALVAKANLQLDTGILTPAEEREKARGRDSLMIRQDRFYRQIETLEDRLTRVRAMAAEAAFERGE